MSFMSKFKKQTDVPPEVDLKFTSFAQQEFPGSYQPA